MNRVKDYVQFATSFVGIGYLALWPVTAHDNDIAALVMTFIGGSHSLASMNAICVSPHALRLSPGLHLIGAMSAACVIVRLLMRQWRHWRRHGLAPAHGAAGEGSPAVGLGVVRWPAKLRRPLAPPPLRSVRPRRQFGLRGAPH
jgi:hypothetical protein